MNTNSTSAIKDFTSGGQLTMHSIRMFGQATRFNILFCLMIFMGLCVLCFYLETESYDRYLLIETVQATCTWLLRGSASVHTLLDIDGDWVQVSAASLMDHPQTLKSFENCLAALHKAFYQAMMGALLSLIGVGAWFYYRGKKQRASKEITGQVRVKPKVLSKLLIQQEKASDFKVAGVPLLKDTEVQHILLAGTTGTGKTVCLQELMDQIRAKKQRAIVYDIEGVFIPHYYREGQDIILNPLDSRCPPWNIWQEGDKASDFEAMASSLMPLHLAGTDPFWIHSARTIFSCAAQRLQMDDKKKMKHLLEPLFSEHLGSLSSLVEHSVAESLVSDKNEKTALSIKATLSTYCKALMYLNDVSKEPLFSIGRWINDEKQDSWLFIASDAQKIEALKPLISLWLDVAAKSILSLSPSDSRRLWFILDELPSLHRLPSFMNTLARARKYGACFVAAIQDVHQLRSIYGRDEAETLTALFNTNVFYRTKCPDSALWMSKVMGGLEILEKKEGYSYGAHEMRDGVSIQQDRRRESVVKEAEFLELNDLQAFLRLPGYWPVTQLQFEPKKRESTIPALVERNLKELLIFEDSNKKKTSSKSVHSKASESKPDHAEKTSEPTKNPKQKFKKKAHRKDQTKMIQVELGKDDA